MLTFMKHASLLSFLQSSLLLLLYVSSLHYSSSGTDSTGLNIASGFLTPTNTADISRVIVLKKENLL